MATQSASLVNLYDYTSGGGMVSNSNSLSLILDPYSGKYYGSDSYDSVVSSMNQAASYYSNIIAKAESGDWGTQSLLQAPVNMLSGMNTNTQLSAYEEAKAALSTIQSHHIDASQYVQQNQMLESYQAHPEGWNNYFESSYKTPRLAEDNAEIAQQNLKAQQSTGGTATGNQLVSSNLEIRKEVGTGVGKESVGLNPFGKLDAGLNI